MMLRTCDAAERIGRSLMRRIETVIVVLALAFYVWFLSHFGTREVLGYVRLAGWGLVLTISLRPSRGSPTRWDGG